MTGCKEGEWTKQRILVEIYTIRIVHLIIIIIITYYYYFFFFKIRQILSVVKGWICKYCATLYVPKSRRILCVPTSQSSYPVTIIKCWEVQIHDSYTQEMQNFNDVYS